MADNKGFGEHDRIADYRYKALMKSAEKLGIDEDDEEVKEAGFTGCSAKSSWPLSAELRACSSRPCAAAVYVASHRRFQFGERYSHPPAFRFLPVKAVEGGILIHGRAFLRECSR